MEWYIKCIKHYADFQDRARRKEYWFFVLFNFIIAVAISLVETIIGLNFRFLFILYSFFIFVPSLSVGVRRLHDTGKSGWWFLIALVPFIGWLVLLYFFIQDSEPNDNEFGPNPKELELLN